MSPARENAGFISREGTVDDQLNIQIFNCLLKWFPLGQIPVC